MIKIIRQNYKENKVIYNKIKNELVRKIGKTNTIDHIGSTAIPDMFGKNIIDILIGAKDINEFEKIKNILICKGYSCSNKTKEKEYQFFSSTKKETSSGDVHIHLTILGTNRYNEFLILKEYLLNNKKEAKEYSNFKQKIIEEGIKDRRKYKEIKSKYVEDLLNKAKKIYYK